MPHKYENETEGFHQEKYFFARFFGCAVLLKVMFVIMIKMRKMMMMMMVMMMMMMMMMMMI